MSPSGLPKYGISANIKTAMMAYVQENYPGHETSKWVNKQKWKLSYYNELEEHLAFCHLSVREMYGLVGIEVPFPDGFQEICGLCEQLPDKTLDKIGSMLLNIAPSWWQNVQDLSPTERITGYVQRMTLRYNRLEDLPDYCTKNAGDGTKLKWKWSLPMEILPKIAVDFNLSLHWILGLGAGTSVYGVNPKTDLVLDAYPFLQDDIKPVFMSVLRELVSEQSE